MAEPKPQAFRLDVPARPEFVSTARLFVATLARILGLDDELVEDLKLATSEAMTVAVLSGREARVAVTAEASPAGSLAVQVGPVGAAELAMEGAGPDPLGVIDALFPGAAAASGTIRFAAGETPPP